VPRRLQAAFASALAVLAFSASILAEQPRTSTQPTVVSPQPEAEPVLHPPVLHALGLMSAMRLTEAYLRPEPFAVANRQRIGLHYREAYSRPPMWDSHRPLFQADGDRWQINVLGHGLFGSELYLRARTCHLVPWQSLLFTGLASATWEYGFEANGVRPSALDLTYTPLAGLVLGEARFQAWRAARRLGHGALRTTLSALVDPLGDVERALGSPC